MSLIRTLVAALIALLVAGQACALSLGNLTIQSKTNEPLQAQIAISVEANELDALKDLQVALASPETYKRLGIVSSATQAQLRVALVRGSKQEPVAIRLSSDEVLKLAQDEVFLDALVELRWPAGLLRRAYTLMVGDQFKVQVKAGDTLTELANKALPQFEDASLDQALIALYRANPQAFAGGSIHRLMVGAELKVPSKAMIQSVPQSEAKAIMGAADKAYRSGKSDESLSQQVKSESVGDRLRVGPAEGLSGEAKRQMEDLLVQERALADAKQRVIEVEKNIADLKRLIEAKEKGSVSASDGWKAYVGPVVITVFILIALVVLLMLSRRESKKPVQEIVIPEHAAKLFASLNLDLSSTANQAVKVATAATELPSPESLRVKLNLVRAYITIEDFGAARRSLDEVLSVSSRVDPDLTIQAKSLLAEIDQRSS